MPFAPSALIREAMLLESLFIRYPIVRVRWMTMVLRLSQPTQLLAIGVALMASVVHEQNDAAYEFKPYAMFVIGILILLGPGCQTPNICCDPAYVARQLRCRTGIESTTVPPCKTIIPSGVLLEDGFEEHEAVQTGLANNSAYQATLAQLGMAGGDAVQASLIANPQLLVYFPSGPKEGQYTLYAPIESYFMRPTRMKIANREYRRIGDQLVQNGLNLARDIRLSYIDLALATEQTALATEAVEIRQGIADITHKRFNNGDISELETIASRVDALNAKANRGVQQQNIEITRARLATIVGLPFTNVPLQASRLPTLPNLEVQEEELVDTALMCRPDLHGARWAIASASERYKLSRWLFWRVDGVVDARAGQQHQRTGAGLRMDLPIFNRNQGGILRADWELNAAMHARDAIHDQIVQEVRVAWNQFRQAQANLQILESEVLPNLSTAIGIANKGFTDGGTDYLLVLQTTSQYLDVRARILDQRATMYRAYAELERSIGRSLVANPLNSDSMASQTLPVEEPARS